MTSMMPEHTKGVFDGYSAYWRKAPEGFEKQNMMQIFEAWGADRARIEALEKERDADWRNFVRLRNDNERIRVLGEELTKKDARIEALERNIPKDIALAVDAAYHRGFVDGTALAKEKL